MRMRGMFGINASGVIKDNTKLQHTSNIKRSHCIWIHNKTRDSYKKIEKKFKTDLIVGNEAKN